MSKKKKISDEKFIIGWEDTPIKKKQDNAEVIKIKKIIAENLDIKIEGLIGVYSGKGPVILVVHSAVELLGTPIPNDEVSEIKWFPIKDLPGLPFPHDKEIMRDYLLKLS